MRRAFMFLLPVAILAALALSSPAHAQGGMPVSTSGGLTTTLQPEDGMAPGAADLLRSVISESWRVSLRLAYFGQQGARTPLRASLKNRRTSAKSSAIRVPLAAWR